MKTKTLSIIAFFLFIGCTPIKTKREYVGGIGSEALHIEAQYCSLGSAQKNLRGLVFAIQDDLRASGVEAQSIDALYIVDKAIWKKGYQLRKGRQLDLTVNFCTALVQKHLDCSDLTLIYLEAAKACGISLKTVFAAGHIFVALPTDRGDIFWEVIYGRPWTTEDYIKHSFVSSNSIASGGYLIPSPPEDALAAVYYEIALDISIHGKGVKIKENLLRKALSIHPNFVNALVVLGAVESAKGDLVSAEATLQKAVTLDPFHGPAYQNLGRLYVKKDDTDKAMAMFEQAIKNNPDDMDSFEAYQILCLSKFLEPLAELEKLGTEIEKLKK